MLRSSLLLCLFVFLGSVSCTKPNPAYCDAQRPCTDPVATHCDVDAQCQSLRNTCVAPQLCKPECAGVPVGACVHDDGCCADGCNFFTDNNCPCGDGVVATGDKPELCDIAITAGNPGACPTAATCTDNDVCTVETFTGEDTCQATCTRTTITEVGPDDGCCPVGANATNDTNCQSTCGNGVVEPGENCEPSILSGAGKCVAMSSCMSDGNPCTTETFTRTSDCNMACTIATITQAKSGDSCCPAGANANTDADCSATCGNGIVESGENCEPSIASGTGKCISMTECINDGSACITSTYTKTSNCNAVCTRTTITQAMAGDGCCPAGANGNTDADCSAVCGNGVVESGENCEPSIASDAGKCVTMAECVNDGSACINSTYSKTSNCNMTCTRTTITQTMPGDGCCPAGANKNTDSDCAAVCGNGVVEAGENCEPSIVAGPQMCVSALSCMDNNRCTTETFSMSSACNVTCTRMPGCMSGDGCCPEGCGAVDTDCPCGNGQLDPGEKCDLGIDPGAPGGCPLDCPAHPSPCKFLKRVGVGCQTECVLTPICVNGDGCCPTPEFSCTNDDDC